MATYIPNATQTTEPVESRTVESAALEFRTLKASINARIEDVQDSLDAEIVNRIAADSVEAAARIAGDANLQTQNTAQDVRLTAIENALLFIGEGSQPGTVYVQRLSGTGAQAVFTLNVVPQSGSVVDIYIHGLYQNKDTFTISGADVTFSEAPPAGTDNIEVQVIETIALGETDASLVTYDGTTVQDKLRSRELADYTALRAFAGTETTVEIVGSGIAGLFNYDASDTVSEDNGGTIIVDAVGRRFKRDFDGSKADAAWFEVDTLGVSDCTSRAQAALTAVDEVVFNGSFLVSAPLVTRAKNRVTTNSGALFSIKSGVPGFDVFQITTSDVVIAGISFNLNKSSVTSDSGSAVSVVSTGDLEGIKVYKNNIIDGSKYGIYVSGPSAAGKHADLKKIGIELYGNEVSGCKSQGILVRNCYGFKFYENEVSYCGGTTMDGVQIGLYKNAVIRSNKAYSNGRHGITLEYGLNFQATENQCWNNGNGGLVIGGGEPTWDAAKNYVIAENICWGNVGPGIQIDPGLSGQANIPVVSPATIEGNVTYSNGGHGIYCQHVRDQTIAGNTSHSNTLDGVAVNGYACQISGNTCTRNRFGVNAQASYAAWSSGAAVAVNAVVLPSAQNGFAFKATVAGTSGGTEPVWPTALGGTVSDGGVTWQAIEQYGYHSVGENTVYENVLGGISVSAQAWRVKNSANSILSDPGAIASMGSIQVTVTCNGATPGQLAKAWFGIPVGGLLIFAEVSAKNTVLVTLFNPTASSINPALSRLYVAVEN